MNKGNNLHKIYYCLLALRLLGPRLFLQKFGCQLYSNTPHFCVGKELDIIPSLDKSNHFLDLSPASSDEVKSFLQLMGRESKTSRYEMLARKCFYDEGFHNCYIGRLTSSNEMASITWLVRQSEIKKSKCEHIFPLIKEDEVFGENIYTLEKFRGKGVMNATGRLKEIIAKKQGFKRIFFIVKEDNLPSLKSSMRRGHLLYKKIQIRHSFFFTRMKIINQYNPPIPISVGMPGIV